MQFLALRIGHHTLIAKTVRALLTLLPGSKFILTFLPLIRSRRIKVCAVPRLALVFVFAILVFFFQFLAFMVMAVGVSIANQELVQALATPFTFIYHSVNANIIVKQFKDEESPYLTLV